MRVDYGKVDRRLFGYLQQVCRELYEHDSKFKENLKTISSDPKAIATRFGNLALISSTSKKLPVIADRNLFFEHVDASNKYDLESLVIDYNRSSVTSRVDANTEVYYRTKSLRAIERWFLESRRMIESERITYVPYMEAVSTTSTLDEYGNVGPSEYETTEIRPVLHPRELFQATIESDIEVSDPTLVPLFNLEIPGFESITPSQLSRLMDDFPEELLGFRNYLQRNLLQFGSKLGSENFARDIRLVELDIQDRLRQLRENYKKLERTTLVESIGGQAITWTLYIFAFLHSPDDLLKVILPGGAVAAIAAAYSKYLREKIDLGNDSVSFLLLVSKEAGSL